MIQIKTINEIGDLVWFFDKQSQTFRNGKIKKFLQYSKENVLWELDTVVIHPTMDRSYKGPAEIYDNKCFKNKLDLLESMSS